MLKGILLILILQTVYARENSSSGIIVAKSLERDLTQMLLKRYRRAGTFGRPVKDAKSKINVSIALTLHQILDLDENKQILRTNGWIEIGWYDSLINWDPKEYGNISTLRLTSDAIWTPEVQLYNYVDERLKNMRDARIIAYNDGSISWVPQALFKTLCIVGFYYFPFDEQICSLDFGSRTMDVSMMDFTWKENYTAIDYSAFSPSNKWKVSNKTKNTKDSFMELRNFTLISNGTESVKSFRVVRFKLRMSRNSDLYVFVLIFPSVLLTMLTMIVFWLPPESPAKMVIGMNIFIAFFILLILLADSTPRAVETFPIIGVFFCMNMVMITLSTFLSTIVLNLYARGEKNGHVNKIIRRIIIDGFGRLLMVRQFIPLQELKSAPETKMASVGGNPLKIEVPEMESNKYTHEERIKRLGLNKASNMSQAETSQLLNSDRWLQKTQVEMEEKNQESGNATADLCLEDSPVMVSSCTKFERDMKELKRFIRMYVNRQKEKTRKNLISMEWRTLALTLDRLFFCVYIIVISLSVVSCFINYQISEKLYHEKSFS